MSRIIGGSAGGRRLQIPKSGSRPTSERVREAVFSALDARLGPTQPWASRRVADLYAGSGALGFEALSRGALSATFVDNTHQSLQTIRANAEALGFAARAQIVKAPVERFVQRPGLAGAFDLVFLDPPYQLPSQSIDTVLQHLAGGTAGTGAGLLAPGGIVLVERSTTTAAPNWPPGWEDIGVKRYGQTVVYWARAGAPAAGQEHDG